MPPPCNNLIILYADEMHGDCLGANGLNSDIQTPHLDALVAHETGDHEFYDLASDRWELDNRFGDPATAKDQSRLLEMLAVWCLQTDPDQPYQRDVHA